MKREARKVNLRRTIWSRLRSLAQSRAVKREIDEELRRHLELRTAENLAAGMSSEDAARAARKRFGNLQSVREDCRDIRGASFGETTLQDIRFGLRMLRRSPAFTTFAVLMLALGIGATTAIFSVVNAVFLRPLPYEDPRQLIAVSPFWLEDPDPRWILMSNKPLLGLRQQSQLLQDIAAFNSLYERNLTGSGEPERLQGWQASANLFRTLGVRPIAGRTFLVEEEERGAERVVVLSEDLWRRRFGSDPNVIGRAITLDNKSHTVVGIVRSDLTLNKPLSSLKPADFWVPLVTDSPDPSNTSGWVIARLKPRVTIRQAQAELDTIAPRLFPEKATHLLRCQPLQEAIVRRARPTVPVLLGAVALVLLIACANVASLLLARSHGRRKEIAIRAAVGAARSRIVRQLVTEAVLLAVAAGTLGALLALGGIKVIIALGAQDIPRLHEATVDGRVLGFTLMVSLLTGIICGSLPAIHASEPDLQTTLKEGGRHSTEGAGGRRSLSLLVISEVALALILLNSAGLLISSLRQLERTNLGFKAEGVLTVRMALSRARFTQPTANGMAIITPETGRFCEQVLQRLEALPGVTSVGARDSAFFGLVDSRIVKTEGQTPQDEVRGGQYDEVSPRYFVTMGIPLLKGRHFTETDREGTPKVVLISETAAQAFFPREDPIGKRLMLVSSFAGAEGAWREVVGVVGDVKQSDIEQPPYPQFYVSSLQPSREELMGARLDKFLGVTLVMRLAPGAKPAGLAGAVRSAIRQVDRNEPIVEVKTLNEIVASQLSERRFYMWLLSSFAGAALVLAAVGIFGVLAYSVSQRTHELGIRMALGAQQSDVLKHVMAQGFVLILSGAALGLVASFGLTRLLASLLYDVKPRDPVTFASTAFLLLTVALLACYVPARRATNIHPMKALRYE